MSSRFQQHALFHKAPFIDLLLGSSCGKQKAQEEEVDKPAGGAESQVRVIIIPTFLFLRCISTVLHSPKTCPVSVSVSIVRTASQITFLNTF